MFSIKCSFWLSSIHSGRGREYTSVIKQGKTQRQFNVLSVSCLDLRHYLLPAASLLHTLDTDKELFSTIKKKNKKKITFQLCPSSLLTVGYNSCISPSTFELFLKCKYVSTVLSSSYYFMSLGMFGK